MNSNFYVIKFVRKKINASGNKIFELTKIFSNTFWLFQPLLMQDKLHFSIVISNFYAVKTVIFHMKFSFWNEKKKFEYTSNDWNWKKKYSTNNAKGWGIF